MTSPSIGHNGGPAFLTLEDMVVAAAESVRPAERITVSQAAELYHMTGGNGVAVRPFDLEKTPYLREPMDVLESTQFTGMAFAGPARAGKALALDTLIPVPDGWRYMGDLDIGDEVFDENGEICRVVATTEIMHDRQCFRITFSDGFSIVADAEHQWVVNDAHRPKTRRTLTTEQILENYKYGLNLRNRYSITNAKPLNLPDKRLIIDPYVFGAWIGDGTKRRPVITSSDEDASEMCANINECGVRCEIVPQGNGKANLLYLERASMQGSRGEFTRLLGLYGLGFSAARKYIPDIYLRASREQRFALLQGLMDTDGSADPRRGQLEFTTTDAGIAESFKELLSSLGYKFGVCRRPAARKIAYRFNFNAAPGDRIFRLKRKQRYVDQFAGKRNTSNFKRVIVNIEPVASVPVRCIQVDSPSHQYLAGRNMVPTHNSVMFINWLIYLAVCDPANMMLVHMSRDTGREWSQQDLERAVANSPMLASRLMPGRQNDNVFDKRFTSGMRMSITWPTIKNLSGKTVGKLWIMDMDRIKPQLIDGEAHVFDATRARARTLRSRGMCAAEASPGFDVTDPKWTPASPHEAPPTQGILSIYNRGDRRRWYWECPHCEGKFEPQFKYLNWDKTPGIDIAEAAASVWMECPHCFKSDGAVIKPAMMPELNTRGRWIAEGQTWLQSGEIIGEARRSKIASFWMFGPAAGTVGPENWEHLVTEFLTATETYEKTGDEGPLRSTVNLNNGEPYLPKSLETGRLPETLKDRAQDWGGSPDEPMVPAEAGGGFLVATVDVQARSFVVHVFLVTRDAYWHVDMFKIRKSERVDEDGERHLIDPAGHAEDWLLLIPQVINRTYVLNDGSGRRMGVKIVGCDSGGKDGVTSNAYEFYRYLRAEGIHDRFHLLKGAPSKTDTGVAMRPTMFDSQKKDRFAVARGDIPGWLINSNFVKDAVNNLLEAPDRVRFPTWAPLWLYYQLTTEIRDPIKGWLNPANRRNEAWDLLCYCYALCTHPDIRLPYLPWDNPPAWAAEWGRNELVFGADGQRQADSAGKQRKSLKDLGDVLG